MKLGIFGGTFDPPHIGHLVAAQELHAQLGLDRLLLVPAAVPPHKRDRAITPPEVRLAMINAAVAGDSRFQVDDLELRRAGPSYTVDTLREMKERHPGTELFLAIGADQLAELHTWREPDEVARLATMVAFARSGQPVPSGLQWEVRTIEVPALHVSSTGVRRRVNEGRPITYLVPDSVEEIVRRDALYQKPPRE